MNNDYKVTLSKILEAIEYSENKNAFIEEFVKNINIQALLNLITTISSDKQEQLKSQLLQNKDNKEKVAEIFKEHFPEEKIEESVKNVAKETMTKYIEVISDTLTDIQKQNLIQIAENLKPTIKTPYSLS